MAVRRIVANIKAVDTAAARRFYGDVLGMDVAMDLGFIVTFAAAEQPGRPQVAVATEGGSGTPVPDLSIEVDDLEDIHRRLGENGFAIEYGPVDEPWGVRRLYTLDPHGRLVNILQHATAEE